MADTKTSAETVASALTGAELVRIVQSSSSKQTTAAVLGHQLRGARARLNADKTAQNITTETAVAFDTTDFDTDSFWSAGSPTKLTMPTGKGITHVALTGQVYVTSSTGDTSFLGSINQYNSSNTLLRTFGQRFIETGLTLKSLNMSTGPITVSDGDYFVLTVREETDNSVTIEGNETIQTFLGLLVVGMQPV